jgi:acetoin utilization protein AcuB
VTLAPTRIEPGTIGRIADIVEGTGAAVHAIYPISLGPKGVASGDHARKVIVRFHHVDTAEVVHALEAAGYEVIESVQAVH